LYQGTTSEELAKITVPGANGKRQKSGCRTLFDLQSVLSVQTLVELAKTLNFASSSSVVPWLEFLHFPPGLF
jgi:hypothetical protein